MALKEILGQLRPEPEREPLPPRRHYEPPSKGDITDDGSLSMTTISEDNFPEPRRTLDKREALRHLIHTAIRLIAEMGDPFAVHLLVHSADKILIDLAKQKGHELRIDCELYVKDEYHDEFFKRHRETYNYFKHADRDFATDLPVRDIAMTNAMNLFITVVNYEHMFGERTHHMGLFLSFIFALTPQIIVTTDIRGVELLKGAHSMQGMTPSEFLQIFKEHREWLPNLYQEVTKDIEDAIDFYHLTFNECEKAGGRARGCSSCLRRRG